MSRLASSTQASGRSIIAGRWVGEAMTDQGLRSLARVIVVVLLATLASPMVLVVPEEGLTLNFAVGFGLSSTIAALAAWLTVKVPRNTVTWLLLLSVSSALLAQAAADYVNATARRSLPGVRLAFFIQSGVFWIGIVLLIVLFPLLFPTGRPPTSRWWSVAWVGLCGGAVQLVRAAYLAATLPLGALEDGETGVEWLDVAVTIGQGLVVAASAAALVSAIVRFVRSAGTERQQLKWMLLPLTFLTLFWIVESVRQETALSMVFLVAGAATLPVSIGVAVLKYRLYEIDRIISRTVTYTLVASVIAGVYAIPVVALPRLLGGTNEAGIPQQAPDLVIAGATLAAAAVFN
ncbi:MAG TPA: hypothetical protein VIY70_12955, partial [Acidimicrobiia bacterium]